MIKNNSRREFLKNLTLAGLGAIATPAFLRADGQRPADVLPESRFRGNTAFPEMRPRPVGAKSVAAMTTDPSEKIRVGMVGESARRIGDVRNVPFAEVVAVCNAGGSWESLCARSDVDVVYAAGSADEILPVALEAMRAGKHVFIEPVSGFSLAACWDLVDASELSQRHCVMLDSLCFGDEELFALNLAESGVLGELQRAECTYDFGDAGISNIRGIAPACRILGLNRNDFAESLVAMSPRGRRRNDSILIKTEKDRMIAAYRSGMSARLFSRIREVAGTDGVFSGFPARLALAAPEKYEIVGNAEQTWLNSDEYAKMVTRFRHPLWKTVAVDAAKNGHGGMNYVMNFRLLDCIRRGITPDITVYDVALWSCLDEIAAHSVAGGSVPVRIPDFTRRATGA